MRVGVRIVLVVAAGPMASPVSVARSFATQVQHVRCAGPCQRDVEERVAIDIAQCEAVRRSF
jgi:hypothetical protein